MPWNGYRDHESDIGEGWDAIENCSLYIKDECRRRLGFGAKVDLSGAVVRSAAELGNYALCATAAGGVVSVTQSTGSVASLATGLSTINWPTWASMNSRLYYSNGVEVRVSDDSTNFRTVGIAAPSSAATATPTGSGGVVTAGVHLFRYRYYDSTRNRLSDPSVAVSTTVTAGQTVTVGYTASGDATVDKIIIEVTAAGSEAYYRAGTITNSGVSTSFNISDEILIVGVSASRDGEFQHQPPPAYDILAEHRQRLWIWKVSNGELAWSRALFPESWDSLNNARKVTLDGGDTPAALASFYSDLYLIGQRSMRRMVYTSDPAAAMVVDVPGNFGAFNARCIIKIDGGLLVGWGRNGAWVIDAMQPKKVSRNIDATLDTLSSPTAITERFIVFEPQRREVLFFFPRVGQTTCKDAFTWSIDTNEWTLYRYRNAMTAGVLNTTYTDRQRIMVCDANGYCWRVGVSANDGGADGKITVTSGTTDTIINAVNTATPGQILYNHITGDERLITVASGSQITLASALSATPSVGQVLFVGSIRQYALSDWLLGGGMNEKKRPTKLLIALRPEGEMGDAIVKYYQDFRSIAIVASSFAADTLPEGVTVSNGVLIVDVDAGGNDGLIPIPTPADWNRVIRCEIIAETPLDGIRFLDIAFRDDSSMKSEEE